ncbi:MAG: STAS domain-containing protein [Clostridia bacterium]|nr:STAS domain-containing protein [Clostridia bacterium]
MTVNKTVEGTKLTLAVEGRVDTNSAPAFLTEFTEASKEATEVVIDLGAVNYISSAGLRVLLSMQKVMNRQGKMTIVNVTPDIMEVFDLTGFTDILNIE